MKTTQTDLRQLLAVVETVRAELHPDLPAALIEAVIEAEEQHPEDDAGAIAAIEAVVKTLSAANE